MTTLDFEALEAQIRAEADKKLAAAKTLATARQALLHARDEFAAIDANNVANYEAALTAARESGFTDRSLAAYNLAPENSGAKRRPSGGARKQTKTTRRSKTTSAAAQPENAIIAPAPATT